MCKILLGRKKKETFFGGSEQKVVVVYIGASGTKVGGGENNGLHIFHCISVPLCLCICSRWNCICM